MTKKELIIQKAIELFAAEGYENTSIQRLAEAAGVAQGLLYRHFKNKNDLLLQLLMTGLHQIQYTLEPYSNKEFSFADAFIEHIKRCTAQLKNNASLWKVLHSVRQNTTLMKSLGLAGDPVRQIIKPIAAKLSKSGYKDTEMHAWAIFSLVDGIASLYLTHPGAYPLEKFEKFLVKKAKEYEQAIQ
jgi:AcrR family transcriptional regulator